MGFLAKWMKGQESEYLENVRNELVWRIARKPKPWGFVDWSYAVDHHFNGRWDDPRGSFRTLYAADTVYGCALEVLEHFRPDPKIVESINEISSEESDVPTVLPGQIPWEWLGQRCVGRGRLYGVYYPVSSSTAIAHLRSVLGIDLDAAVLRDAGRRSVTQQVAAYVRNDLGAAGIRYQSRHGDEVRMFGIFEHNLGETEPSHVRDRVILDLESDTRGLVDAMVLYGLRWASYADESLPSPIIEPAEPEELRKAMFPPDGIPRTSYPLGAVALWLDAIRAGDLGSIDKLTWRWDAWDFEETKSLVEGMGLKQYVSFPVEEGFTRDDIAHVCLIRMEEGEGRILAGAFLDADQAIWLTTVKVYGRWKVWGIGRKALPEEVRKK